MHVRGGYVYIVTNSFNSVIYTGVTSDLKKRAFQHRQKEIEGFSKRYNLTKLVYYEVADRIESAILREKQIKGLLRKKKIDLIEGMNPSWRDLFHDL